MVYWAKFLSIVGFIGIGLMTISALTVIGFTNGNQMGITIASIYICFAILYFFPINHLYVFATKTRKALNSHNQNDLDLGLSALASNFKFIGILTVIIVSIYGLIFILGRLN